MARITITIEGDEQELAGALQRLLVVGQDGAAGQGGNGAPAAAAAAAPAPAAGWSPEELAAYLSMVKEDARRIVTEVAKRPEGYPFDDLQEVLGMGAQNIGGRLSSVGHALRRFPGKPGLIERDYRQRAYRMDPEVAKTIRELAVTGDEA